MSATTALDAITEDPAFTMGDRIAKRRRDRDLDQSDIAEALGVSRPLVSKWERNVSIPDVEQAKRLADFLDCSFGWLCGVDPRSRCFSPSALVDGIDAIAHATREIRGQRQLAIRT